MRGFGWTRALLVLGLALRLVSAAYTEHLNIQPLPRNSLLTTFSFESSEARLEEADAEYAIFPRALGQIIQLAGIHELHLRFSQGWWDADSWGAPPDHGQHSGGIGVELWAWIQADSQADANVNWRKLVHTLSGLFCASLNFIDDAHTTFPVKTFEPFGDVSSSLPEGKQLYLMRGALPGEPVCTENLTPFLKMLPCKGKAGISSLLDGHKIFDALWQGMAIDVFIEENEGVASRKMTQTISLVTDMARALSRNDSPVPLPIPYENLRCNTSKESYDGYTCFPLGESTEIDWHLSDVFGREIAGSCPLADNDKHVSVNAPEHWQTRFVTSQDENYYIFFETREFALEPNKAWDVQLKTDDSSLVTENSLPPVLVDRSFTGYGQERGGLRTVFTNPSPTEWVRFVYFESLPWYMRVYLHTLDLAIQKSEYDVEKEDLLKDIFYLPALDRKRPTQLELEIALPPATSAALSYDFDKSLLYIEEYPPDANHGFDIAPGVLTTLEPASYTLRTTSLLLSLPTPDFSMPYNVIILTGTVMALAYGTLFNLFTKRVMPEEEAEELGREAPISKAVTKFRNRIKNLLERRLGERQRGPYVAVDAPNHELVPDTPSTEPVSGTGM